MESKEKLFCYTLTNLKQPNTFIYKYRKLDWQSAISLCLELNQAARDNNEMPDGWQSLYVITGDE